MPIYLYRCQDCGETSEVRHTMDHQGAVACPNCDSASTQRVITCPGIVFDWKNMVPGDHIPVRSERYRGPAVPLSVKQ